MKLAEIEDESNHTVLSPFQFYIKDIGEAVKDNGCAVKYGKYGSEIDNFSVFNRETILVVLELIKCLIRFLN